MSHTTVFLYRVVDDGRTGPYIGCGSLMGPRIVAVHQFVRLRPAPAVPVVCLVVGAKSLEIIPGKVLLPTDAGPAEIAGVALTYASCAPTASGRNIPHDDAEILGWLTRRLAKTPCRHPRSSPYPTPQLPVTDESHDPPYDPGSLAAWWCPIWPGGPGCG